jgi:rhombotail lipoprotein
MQRRIMVLLMAISATLSGCAVLGARPWCAPNCPSQHQSSSSLVNFLYPSGKALPAQNAIPELRLPLRVGLAFLPSSTGTTQLDATHKAELLDRIRAHFADRKFVSDIVIVPDYYLAANSGYSGLEAVQRLYSVDVMALVSYDQVTHQDDNQLSLGYLTIVGAFILPGNSHEVATLVDLAVIDPVTRSLVLRAGGIDRQHGN